MKHVKQASLAELEALFDFFYALHKKDTFVSIMVELRKSPYRIIALIDHDGADMELTINPKPMELKDDLRWLGHIIDGKKFKHHYIFLEYDQVQDFCFDKKTKTIHIILKETAAVKIEKELLV